MGGQLCYKELAVMKTIVTVCKSHRAFAILSLAVLIFPVGCKQNSSEPEVPDKSPRAGIIRITPSELFAGELKKIESRFPKERGKGKDAEVSQAYVELKKLMNSLE